MSANTDQIQDARQALRRGYSEEAEAILIKVIVNDPEDVEAWLLLAEALSFESKKLECLERARVLNPRNPAILRAIGQLTGLPQG